MSSFFGSMKRQRKGIEEGKRSRKRGGAASSSSAPAPESSRPLPLTKYERVRLIGSRAGRLARGQAKPLVDLPGVLDPLVIAQEEFRLGLLRSHVVRVRPDGERERYGVAELAPGPPAPS